MQINNARQCRETHTHSAVLEFDSTHLQDLVGRVCLVVVEESVVDHLTCPLPIGRQLHHLHWWCGGPLCETVHRGILQQSVVTNSTEHIDLKENKKKWVEMFIVGLTSYSWITIVVFKQSAVLLFLAPIYQFYCDGLKVQPNHAKRNIEDLVFSIS